jgi:transcriptional regulator with XRE-family HTH domain
MKQNEKDLVEFIDDVIEHDTALSDFEKIWAPLASFLTDYEHLKGLKGLTQKDIANTCGTTQSAISRLERMRGKPTYELLRRLSEAVGGDIFVTPMAEVSVTLPYDLQERARCLAKNQEISVTELMQNLLRNGIDNAEYRYDRKGTNFHLGVGRTDQDIPSGQYSRDVMMNRTVSCPDVSVFSYGEVV